MNKKIMTMLVCCLPRVLGLSANTCLCSMSPVPKLPDWGEYGTVPIGTVHRCSGLSVPLHENAGRTVVSPLLLLTSVIGETPQMQEGCLGLG